MNDLSPDTIKAYQYINWNKIFKAFGKNPYAMKNRKEFKSSEVKLINSFLKQNGIILVNKEEVINS